MLAASVAAGYGQGLPQRLAEALAPRPDDHMPDWPLRARQKVAAELCRAGLTVGWLPSVLTELEHQADRASAASRLGALASLVTCHARADDLAQAARLARTLVPAAFGIGIGREYQLSTWAEWLIRALRETPTAAMVAEATWMARLLAATHDETDCLTRLVGALATRHDAHDLQQRAADFTAGVIASGSGGTHPDTATIPPGAPAYDDHGSLCLTDGRSIAWSDVPAIAPDAASVIALRQSETADSTLDWPSLIQRLPLSSGQGQAALGEAFPPDSRDGTEVLTVLAERARANGDMTQAARLADLVLRHAPRDWSSWYRGATRRRANAVAIAAGGPHQRLAACQEIAEHVLDNQWLSPVPAEDLCDLITELDPAVTASASWSVIRRHLDGLAETLALPHDNALESTASTLRPGEPSPDPKVSRPADTAASALAELAVRHLAHPAQDVRVRAHVAIARTLAAGNPGPEVAEALERLTEPGP